MAKKIMNLNGNLVRMNNPKVIGGFVTLAVLALLILAGPAQALSLSLTGFSLSTPHKGEICFH